MKLYLCTSLDFCYETLYWRRKISLYFSCHAIYYSSAIYYCHLCHLLLCHLLLIDLQGAGIVMERGPDSEAAVVKAIEAATDRGTRGAPAASEVPIGSDFYALS